MAGPDPLLPISNDSEIVRMLERDDLDLDQALALLEEGRPTPRAKGTAQRSGGPGGRVLEDASGAVADRSR
jgi:hypothetical protein